jgi:hypothetical protein
MTNKKRKKGQKKTTLQRWYGTSRNFGPCVALLHQVLDSAMPDVTRACISSDNSASGLGVLSLTDRGCVSFDTPSGSRGSGETRVLSSTPGVVHVSDDSTAMDNEFLAELPLDEENSSDEVDSPPKKKKKKGKETRTAAEIEAAEAQKRYDRHRKFKNEWQAKLPWAEGALADDGILHMVKCVPCSAMEKKKVLMAPKSDTLFKLDRKRVAKKDMPLYKVKKGQHYIATQCKHNVKKNLKLFHARPLATIAQVVQQCSSVEHVKKRIQFATLFQILSVGRPILEYEDRFALNKFLNFLTFRPRTGLIHLVGFLLNTCIGRSLTRLKRR